MTVTKAQFQYLVDDPLWLSEKPFVAQQIPGYEGGLVTNVLDEWREARLVDVRTVEEKPQLATHSFEFRTWPSKLLHLSEKDMMVPYAQEINGLMEFVFGTKQVITYDIRYRERREYSQEEAFDTERSLPSPVITMAHIDHTRKGGRYRLGRHLSEEELHKYTAEGWRIRIVNVWRPLVDRVEDSPLALIDPRSIGEADVMAADRISPLSIGEVYYLKYNPGYRWYWLKHQSSDEVAIFVQWDSLSQDENQPFNHVGHASFTDPDARADCPPRKSVETRTIVCTRD